MPEKNKKRTRFGMGGIRVKPRDLDLSAIRSCAENNPQEFVSEVLGDIEAGKITWDTVYRDSSLPDLFSALHGIDFQASIDIAGRASPIMTGAFPVVTGALAVEQINLAYDAVEGIGDQLVTDVESNKQQMTIVGVLGDAANNTKVPEGGEFPLVGATEQRFDVLSERRGMRLQISQEMLEENDIPGVVDRLNQVGEAAAEISEEETLKRVTDYDGSASTGAEPYALHLANAVQKLYVTANTAPLGRLHASGNRITNNALTDTSDLDTARARLAGMTNSRGKRVSLPVSEMILLVPDAVVGVALKLLQSELQPAVLNEINAWGPRGRWRPRLLSSPKLDDLSSSAWYMGLFARQFVRKLKIGMEIVTLSGAQTLAYLQRRIAFETRICWDTNVGARDYIYVVQNLDGTTTPKDE